MRGWGWRDRADDCDTTFQIQIGVSEVKEGNNNREKEGITFIVLGSLVGYGVDGIDV